MTEPPAAASAQDARRLFALSVELMTTMAHDRCARRDSPLPGDSRVPATSGPAAAEPPPSRATASRGRLAQSVDHDRPAGRTIGCPMRNGAGSRLMRRS